MVNPKVYVFGCDRTLGFSLKETGEDLPARPGRRWIQLKSAELSPDFLRELPVDHHRLLREVVSCGFHVTKQLPGPRLPVVHRQSA